MSSVYEQAIAAYEDSVNDLKNMGKVFQQFAAQKGVSYDPRVTLNQFDILLQYSMLQVALADGHLDAAEINFIKDIAQYSDFCFFLQEHGFSNASWQAIYNTRESKLNRILDDAEATIIHLSQDFIDIFALCDAVSGYDFLADLKENVITMIFATCKADGVAEKSEINSGCLILGALGAIEKRIREYEA